jgi:hypothetical protein
MLVTELHQQQMSWLNRCMPDAHMQCQECFQVLLPMSMSNAKPALQAHGLLLLLCLREWTRWRWGRGEGGGGTAVVLPVVD